MKKIVRAGSSHGRDRDGHNGRKGSQGGKNKDGHQGGGATAATGSPNTSTYTTGGGDDVRGGSKSQRGVGGNQGTKRGGGSDRSRGQEYTGADQDVPAHTRSTVASQSKVKIDIASLKKPDASAPKITTGAAVSSNVEKLNPLSDAEVKRVFGVILNDPTHEGAYNATGKTSELNFYKGEYRKLKSEIEDLRSNLDSFTNTLEEKDAEIDKVNRFVDKKAAEFGELEEKYMKMEEDFKASQAKSAQLKDSANKLTSELEDKDAKVLKLTMEVNDYEKLLKQAQHKNAEVVSEYNKLKDHSVKLQDKLIRYKQHHEKTMKEIEQLKEENKRLSQSRDEEVTKWEIVEQKLAQTKVDLAEAQATVDVGMENELENEHTKKKMTELATKLEEKNKELEYSKKALEKKDRENLQMKNDYQQQLEEKMRILATEYEEKLKTTEARAESAEKSVNWSHVKANESEKQQEQLNNIIDELKAKNKALTKENEDNKSIREKEHQCILELADEVTKLQGTNKQMEDAINNKEAELTKMISKLKEAETSKLELEKMQQSNLANKQSEELQKRNDETMKQFENTLKEKDVTISKLKLDMNKMEQELKELKEHISSAEKKDKENLLQENDDSANSAKLQQLIEEKEKQMQAGYKEREDRIAELEEFINDQVTELDKMEAAMKQTVANKEFAEKELNEALEKKQAELTALQVAYEAKEKEFSQSVSPDDKEESSRVSSELAKAEEKLAEANKQLLAYKKEIQELNESLAKQESTSSKGSVDTDGLRETTKRLTREVAMLKQQNSELKEQNESLSKRCENYRSSSEVLREMMQKQPGMNVTIGKTSRDHSPDDMDQLLKEHQGVKHTQGQLYESYQKLKERYRQSEEEVDRLGTQYSQLQTDFEKQRAELNKAKEELEKISEFVQEQHEKLVGAERDRDTARAMVNQKESEQKKIELYATITEMRSNHSLLIKSKDDEIEKLRKNIDSKEFEIAELSADKKDLEEKLARKRSRVSTTQVDSDRGTEVLQGCSKESAHPSLKNSTLVAVSSESLLREKEQTIEKLSKEVEQLQKQKMKSSDDSGVGDPCVEHAQSGGVGESPNEGNRHADDSYIKGMENEHTKKKVTELATELKEKKKELENSKKALEKLERENLQMKNDYQQQLEEKMRIQATEYEEKLKATETRAENAEKSVNWSHVKANESEKQQEQLNNIIDELKAKNKALTKENEDNKSICEKEHQRILELADEVKKLQGTNKQMEDAINNKEAELTKMISQLKEAETSKLELEKMQQSNLANKQSEELQKRNDETMKQLESTLKEKDVTINKLKLDVNKMEQELKKLKEHISSTEKKDKENLLQENDDPAKSAKLQQVMEEKEKQMQAGYKEREDRIAELEEFINDQVTELDKMEAAMKQTVANKEFAEKELNEALEKKQAELTALQVAYEEKEKKISQSVSPMYDDKEESSRVSSELAQAEEKLAEANKQLLAYKEEIQELNETLEKQENTSSKGSVDADGLRETTKRLTREIVMLKKQNLELKEQNESLSKRQDNYKSSCELLTEMMQKQPGMEMQTKFATKINELNQQVTHLQQENEKFQSLTTGATSKPSHESDQEFHSSVGHIDQPAQLQKRLKELESELESTRPTLEAERKRYEEKLEEMKAEILHIQSTKQNVSIGKTSRDHSPDDIDQLLKEHQGVKHTQGQLYESYQKLKERYRQSEEEVDRLGTQYSQLQTDFEKQRAELNEAKEELERVSEFVQEQHEKLIVAERDRDTATAVMNQKESEQKIQIELNAVITEMRSNHSLLIKSKDDEIEKLRKDIYSKEFEIAKLSADKKDLEEKLAQRRSRVSTTQVDSDQGTEVLQDCSKESIHPSPALVAISSESLLREKEQTIEKLSKEVEWLQKQQMKSSDDSGVGGPCVEHTQSGGVGADDYYTKVDKLTMELKQATETYCVRLVQEIKDQEKKATKAFQSQLLESQHKIDELTKGLAVERNVTDNAKIEVDNLRKQLQQLEKQKNAGYKEREDRIAELEEFINDQVTELERMEAAMKQTVHNKEMAEKELNEALKKKQAELIALQVACDKKDEEINDRVTELAAMKKTAANKEIIEKELKSQLSQSQSRVGELTKELAVERSVTDNAKSEMDKLIDQLQQLQNDKRTIEQQMNAGYKEREERIAELEEFINDQVTELDKMEAAMKQTVHNKEIAEKELNEALKKKQAELIALQVACDKKDEEINDRVTELAAMKKTAANKEIIEKELKSQLSQSQRRVDELTKELAVERSVTDNAKSEMDKLMSQLQQLQNDKRTIEQQMNAGYKEREERIAELEEFINDQVTELDKMEAEMKQTVANKQLLEENYQVQKVEMEQHINVLKEQLEKALDPLELKEVADLGEEIGRGAFGLVKKVSVHGTICAAKDIHAILMRYASDEELERIKKSFLEECVKCNKLFHPNIVQFLGIHYPSKQAKLPWLVMELLDCSLTTFIKKYDDESVSLFVKASIFCDISLGLEFLHGQNIIHRDLSSNNILLSKHLTAKIADLGVAKLIDPDGSKSHTLAPGTKTFLPPEVFSVKRQYGKPVDVFALGCVMIHVITRQWPDPVDKTYYDETKDEMVVLKESARRETYLNKIEKSPFKNFILNCLHDSPKQRPEIAMVVSELQKLKDSCPKLTLFNIVEFELHSKLQQKTILEKERELAELKKTEV